jgi:GAF domain-containing protein
VRCTQEHLQSIPWSGGRARRAPYNTSRVTRVVTNPNHSEASRAVTAGISTSGARRAREDALTDLAASAARNVPGVDFVSITIHGEDDGYRTVAASDPLAEQLDTLQYELREGPCYAAVTDERFVVTNDLAAASDFPRYGARAADLGVGSQAAVLFFHDGERAGLNLYARSTDAFDRSTVQLAELFATQAASVLEYAVQVEQLSEALHTRTDIGIAVGIVMERYGVDRDRAFAFLVRNSNDRNVKIRLLAQQIIAGAFPSTSREEARSRDRA